jgi:hypothetical protein
MRMAAFGAGVVASLVTASVLAALAPKVGFAQRTSVPATTSSAGLIALATDAGDGRQQITVIDPQTRVLGVYHVQLSNGEVTLKAVRNIHWDLQMIEYNGTSPLPQEVRAMLEQMTTATHKDAQQGPAPH